jgi:hypothetical protein
MLGKKLTSGLRLVLIDTGKMGVQNHMEGLERPQRASRFQVPASQSWATANLGWDLALLPRLIGPLSLFSSLN